MKGTLAGKYGKILPCTSMIALMDSNPAAAILFNWSESEQMPLLVLSMTRAKYKGRRFATELIEAGLASLSVKGYLECCLVVTEANEPDFSICFNILASDFGR